MLSIAEIFDYLLDTKIGNATAVVIGALCLYGLFKIVIKIIDYFVFKKLMKSILDAVYSDGSEDGEKKKYENTPTNHHEDEQSQKKDKKREQLREVERMINMENDIRSGQASQRPKKQIVGMAKPIGKWTARVAKQMLQRYSNIDMNLVNEKGYFQALVIAEKQRLGMGQNHNQGGGRSR